MIRNRVMQLTFTVLVMGAVTAQGSGDQIALGLIELNGSSTIKTVSAAALAGKSGLTGTTKNKLGNGQAIKDLTVEVRKKGGAMAPGTPPVVGDVTVTNGEASYSEQAQNGASGGLADIDFSEFPGSFGGDSTADVEIEIDSAGSATDVEVVFTCSTGPKPEVGGADANLLRKFAFTAMADSARHGIDSMWRDRLAFIVESADADAAIVELTGEIVFPEGSSATLLGAYLQNPEAGFTAVSGTQVTISGATFALSEFTPLEPGKAYEVVLVFSETFAGRTLRVRTTAGYGA